MLAHAHEPVGRVVRVQRHDVPLHQLAARGPEQVELLARVLGEGAPGVLDDDALERLDELFEGGRVEAHALRGGGGSGRSCG